MRLQAYVYLGWSPLLAVASDGERRVLEVVGWEGGTGTAPATGLYVGATGYVANIADGVDIRGDSGAGVDIQVGTSVISTGNAVFSNSNGVSFGINGNTITASFSNAGGGGVAISGGTNSQSSGTVNFSNSNGVSFGLNTNGVMTATVATNYQSQGAYLTTAMQSNAATISNIKVSAGTLSALRSDISFSNSNGVSFGLNTNGVITATVATNYQSQGAYLTTAMQSNAGSNFVGTNTALTGNGVAWTVNSSGISLNVPAFLTTAAQSNHSHNFATTTTNGSVIVVGTTNSNGVTIGVPPFLTTAQSAGAYLTTAAQSNQVVNSLNGSTGQISLNVGSSLSASTNGSSITFGLASNITTALQSAGNYLTTAMQSNRGSDFVQANAVFAGTNASGTIASNGISISVNAPGGGGGAALKGSGTYTQNTGTIEFANSNGITFGLSNNGTMTASHNGLTTAMQSNAGSNFLGTNTALTANGVSVTANSSGLSLNFPAFLTTAAQSNNVVSAINGFVGQISIAVGSSLSSSTNGSTTTFGLASNITTALQSAGNYLTTARASNDGIGTNTAQSNVTWTVNSNGLSLDARNYAGTGTTFNGANLSASMTLNSNGLNLSMSANAPGGGGNINVSAGTTSNNMSNVVFSNANGVSFGLNGSTVTASVSVGGGLGYTASSVQNRQLGVTTTLNSNGGQNSLWLSPMRLVAPVSASTIIGAMISYSGTITSAATAQAGQTIQVGIWSQNTDPASSTRFGTWWTGAASLTFWNSGTSSVSYAYSQSGGNSTGSSAGSNLMTASVMGVRHILMPINSTMPAGLYVVGVLNSSSSAGYSAAMSRMALYMDNPMSVGAGTFGQATNNSIGFVDGGTYLTTTAALPSTLALNQIGQVANAMPFFKIGAI